MRWALVAALCISSLWPCLAQEGPPDADGDFISDAAEAILGTDPQQAEQFSIIVEHPVGEARPGGVAAADARYDVGTVWLAKVAPGRWLWAICFAEPYRFDNSYLLMYLDTDDNPQTGRSGTGADLILGQREGVVSALAFDAQGNQAPVMLPRMALDGGVLYFCYDVTLAQSQGASRFRLGISSERLQPRGNADMMNFVECSGPPDAERAATGGGLEPFVIPHSSDAGPDTDGDGISDALEQRGLGTDPQFPEKLYVVTTSPTYEPAPTKPARCDVTRVAFGNVAQGRWLWAIEFAEGHQYSNATVVLYLDTDCDPNTGRSGGEGIDVIFAVRMGQSYAIGYTPDGTRTNWPSPRIALRDGVLLMCGDTPLKQVDGQSQYRFTLRSELLQPRVPCDVIERAYVIGPGDSDRTTPLSAHGIPGAFPGGR